MRLVSALPERNEPAVAIHAECEEIERSFGPVGTPGEIRAMGPLSLKLRRGEFLSVIGPSGCGKSTFLDVLGGMLPPTRGRVLFEGQPVGNKVPDGVGAVFQEDATLPWLTVWDNVAFGLRHAGAEAAEIRRGVDEALAFMGLGEFARAYPNQLSGGMRQRTCIARTLVMRPRLILLDEPFAALDAQTRLLMGDELLRLWRETGATVVLITHALEEAGMLSDRVAAMSARPGCFLELIETGWSADRDSRILASKEFGTLSSRLWGILREESLKALSLGNGTPAGAGR